MKKAFFSGSFDPFTIGHLAVVCEALKTYDEVVIGIGVNPLKTPMFSVEERIEMINKSLDDFLSIVYYRQVIGDVFSSFYEAAEKIENNPDCIKIVYFSGLPVDAAIKNKADTLIVGCRSQEEKKDLMYYNQLSSRQRIVSLVCIDTSPDFSYIFSSSVKQLMEQKEYIKAQDYVLPSVHNILCRRFLRDEYYNLTSVGDEGFDFLMEKLSSYMFPFSKIACCLKIFRSYKSDNLMHNMGAKEYEMAIFWFYLICHSMDLNGKYEKIAYRGMDFELIAKMCGAMNKLLWNETGDGLEGDILCDVASATFGFKGKYSLEAWKSWRNYVNYYDRELTYVLYRRELCNRYTSILPLFKTEYFSTKYGEIAKENLLRELDGLNVLIQEYKQMSEDECKARNNKKSWFKI